ncbi:hypothetical protein BMI91_19665 [Thioclava sediminum]|uniref:Uncharacterized protein n=1 Tax=Thioclava sediminum TaxID=1915319 RepID=A0ABX3MSX0_9RHOB|nr:hypothetical protein [Thioclava sediminum]OOY22502.1 hypothetical protein BMI91_19665 [Thioclava sediminum]
MKKYALDTSLKAVQSRFRRGFIYSGAHYTLFFSPVVALIFGVACSSFEIGICIFIATLWSAFIETYAGARVLKETDKIFVDVLNKLGEGGAA